MESEEVPDCSPNGIRACGTANCSPQDYGTTTPPPFSVRAQDQPRRVPQQRCTSRSNYTIPKMTHPLTTNQETKFLGPHGAALEGSPSAHRTTALQPRCHLCAMEGRGGADRWSTLSPHPAAHSRSTAPPGATACMSSHAPKGPAPLLGSRHKLPQEKQSVRASTKPGIQFRYWDPDTSSRRSDKGVRARTYPWIQCRYLDPDISSRRSDRVYAQVRTHGSSTVTGNPK